VIMTVANNSTGNTIGRVFLYPAWNTDGTGTQAIAAQGSTVFASGELYATTWSHSPLLTTGGTTKTREADVEATVPAAYFSDGIGAIEFELTPLWDGTATGSNQGIITPASTAASRLLYFPSTGDGFIRMRDGTNQGQLNVGYDVGQTLTVKARWNSNSNMDFSVDGVAEGGITFDSSFDPSGNITLFRSLTQGACISDIRFYPVDLGEDWL